MPRAMADQDQDLYLVNQRLSGVPISAIFTDRSRLLGRKVGAFDLPSSDQNQPEIPVPVSPDGKLVAGQLYKSSVDPAARYYLPIYKVNVVGGLYQASLKWSSAATPGAPLARLTLDLAAQAPEAAGFTLLPIEHDAIVRLGYHLPVEGGAPPPSSDVNTSRPTLWYELGALQQVTPGVRRCQLDIFSKPDFDRVYQIMTNDKFGGLLEIHCFATVGHRTWRQIVIDILPPQGGHKGSWGILGMSEEQAAEAPAAQEQVYRLIPTELIEASSPTTLGEVGTIMPSQIGLVSLNQQPIFSTTPARLPIGQIASPPIFVNPAPTPIKVADPSPIFVDIAPNPQPIPIANPKVAVKQLDPAVIRLQGRKLPELIDESDLFVKRGSITQPAIPVGALVNNQGEPVLLHVPVEAVQELNPFCFPIATNGYMFDLPGNFDPTPSRALIPIPFTSNDGRSAMFFYDTGLELFYCQPTEFRLSRTAHPPDQAAYQPYLVITMVNVMTTASDQEASTTSCQVNLTYRALPYFDPELRELARNHPDLTGWNPMPRFAALDPVKTSLTLQLPQAAATTFELMERPDVVISFQDGLADNITVSDQQFLPITAAFIAGAGLEGTVNAQVLDRNISVKLRLSLNDTAGPLFDSTYNGCVDEAEGIHRITLTNCVESAVQIARLESVVVAPNVSASPQTIPSGLIAPGKSVVVDYQVTPRDSHIVRIDPIVIGNVVLDNQARTKLWRQLLEEQGYTSDTFQVNVAIDPSYFAPSQPQDTQQPKGPPPLTSVQIEFRGAESITLTQAAPTATATLRQGYLAMILGELRSYKYRVINQYADGSEKRTDWQSDELPDLSVTPA
jgi:hypothetical protein